MKKTLLTTTALIAGLTANAFAVDVEVYGQVNKLLMAVDDGRDTDVSVGDNDYSSTRFGVKGSQVLDNGLTASVLLEAELQDNASDTVTQVGNSSSGTTATTDADDYGVSGGSFESRHARVGIAGDFGALFLGQTSTASDSTTEQDLAGTKDVLGSDVEDIGGGYVFRNTAGTGSQASVATFTNNMDGNGRASVIRYDSPIFNGFQARASVAQGGDMDLALYYRGTYDAFEVAAAIGYLANNDNVGDVAESMESQLSGSVSVKHDSGLGATFAYGQQDLEEDTAANEDPEFFYAKVGYTWDAFEVAADYGKFNDNLTTDTTDHDVKAIGFGAQYNMGNGVSVSALYRTFDLDYTGTATEEVDIFALGARVKF